MSDVGTAPSALLARRYRLDDVIGRGGMAEVYAGFDTQLGRRVAVKLFQAGDVSGDTTLRHRSEVAMLARLDHPALVTLLDGGVDGDRPFVVMQLIVGTTLAACCGGRPRESGWTASVGAALADALAYVHAQGVVHRDVKPANVLIDETGRVRLADFGIARLVDTAGLTATGVTVGTAAYLAPEQVSGEPAGPPADVYALGLLLLECLTGVREYPGSAVEAALARLSRDPTIPPTLPPGWQQLLTAMTARSPAARPTAEQAGAALRGLREAPVGVSAAVSTQALSEPVGTAPVAGSARVRRRRHRLVLLVAVAVAALIAAVALVAVSGGGGAPVKSGPVGHSPVPAPPGPARLGSDLQQLRQAVTP